MKIRNGFVTNSSSSSFIISKTGRHSIDSIAEAYNFIKGLYTEYINKYEEVLNRVIADAGCEEFYEFFKNKYGFKELYNSKGIFARTYGVDAIDLSECQRVKTQFSKWRDCETYEDYVKAATIKSGEYSHVYPFEIFDYREVESPMSNFTLTETVSWYDYSENEDNENYKDMTFENESDDTVRKRLLMLGNIGIHSECGYIPEEIVDKLIEMSAFSCNHMG